MSLVGTETTISDDGIEDDDKDDVGGAAGWQSPHGRRRRNQKMTEQRYQTSRAHNTTSPKQMARAPGRGTMTMMHTSASLLGESLSDESSSASSYILGYDGSSASSSTFSFHSRRKCDASPLSTISSVAGSASSSSCSSSSSCAAAAAASSSSSSSASSSTAAAAAGAPRRRRRSDQRPTVSRLPGAIHDMEGQEEDAIVSSPPASLPTSSSAKRPAASGLPQSKVSRQSFHARLIQLADGDDSRGVGDDAGGGRWSGSGARPSSSSSSSFLLSRSGQRRSKSRSARSLSSTKKKSIFGNRKRRATTPRATAGAASNGGVHSSPCGSVDPTARRLKLSQIVDLSLIHI